MAQVDDDKCCGECSDFIREIYKNDRHLLFDCHQAASLCAVFNVDSAEIGCRCFMCHGDHMLFSDYGMALTYLAHKMDYKLFGRADLNCTCGTCTKTVPLPVHGQEWLRFEKFQPFLSPVDSSSASSGASHAATGSFTVVSDSKLLVYKLNAPPSTSASNGELVFPSSSNGHLSGISKDPASSQSCFACGEVTRAKLFLVFAAHKLLAWLENCELPRCSCALCIASGVVVRGTPGRVVQVANAGSLPVSIAHNFEIFFARLETPVCGCANCAGLRGKLPQQLLSVASARPRVPATASGVETGGRVVGTNGVTRSEQLSVRDVEKMPAVTSNSIAPAPAPPIAPASQGNADSVLIPMEGPQPRKDAEEKTIAAIQKDDHIYHQFAPARKNGMIKPTKAPAALHIPEKIVLPEAVSNGKGPWSPTACAICGKRFSRPDHVYDHQRMKHPIKGPIEAIVTRQGETDVHTCSYCLKPCVSLTRFEKHKKIHSGLKPKYPPTLASARKRSVKPQVSGAANSRSIAAVNIDDPTDALTKTEATTGETEMESANVDTKDLCARIAHELKAHSIPQAVFAERILGRTQGCLSELLRNPKPWAELKSGRETFRRMWRWLKHPLPQRVAILELWKNAGEGDVARVQEQVDQILEKTSKPTQRQIKKPRLDFTGEKDHPCAGCGRVFRYVKSLEKHKCADTPQGTRFSMPASLPPNTQVSPSSCSFSPELGTCSGLSSQVSSSKSSVAGSSTSASTPVTSRLEKELLYHLPAAVLNGDASSSSSASSAEFAVKTEPVCESESQWTEGNGDQNELDLTVEEDIAILEGPQEVSKETRASTVLQVQLLADVAAAAETLQKKQLDARFACDLCDYRCSDSDWLQKHRAKEHPGAKAGPSLLSPKQGLLKSPDPVPRSRIASRMSSIRTDSAASKSRSPRPGSSKRPVDATPKQSPKPGGSNRPAEATPKSSSKRETKAEVVRPKSAAKKTAFSTKAASNRKAKPGGGKNFHFKSRNAKYYKKKKSGRAKPKTSVNVRFKATKAQLDESWTGDGPGPKPCRVCGENFPSFRLLYKHQRDLHPTAGPVTYYEVVNDEGELIFGCSFCKKLFSSRQEFRQHRQAHSVVFPFQCKRCKTRFRWQRALLAHAFKCSDYLRKRRAAMARLRKKQNETSSSSTKRSSLVKGEVDLLDLPGSLSPEDNVPLASLIPRRIFGDSSGAGPSGVSLPRTGQLGEATAKAGPSSKGPVKILPRPVLSSGEAAKAGLASKGPAKIFLVCAVPSVRTGQPTLPVALVQVKQEEPGNAANPCVFCGETFATRNQLFAHQRDSHPIPEADSVVGIPYTNEEGVSFIRCSFCKQLIRTMASFNRHKSAHCTESTNVVNIRPVAPPPIIPFARSNRLAGRPASASPSVQVKEESADSAGGSEHQCVFCGESFSTPNQLYAHQRASHPIPDLDSIVGVPHTNEEGVTLICCSFCKKLNGDMNKFKKHKNAHAANPLMPCERCGRAYRDEHHLKMHRRKCSKSSTKKAKTVQLTNGVQVKMEPLDFDDHIDDSPLMLHLDIDSEDETPSEERMEVDCNAATAHVAPTKPGTFVCAICELSYVYRRGISRHLRLSHEETPASSYTSSISTKSVTAATRILPGRALSPSEIYSPSVSPSSIASLSPSNLVLPPLLQLTPQKSSCGESAERTRGLAAAIAKPSTLSELPSQAVNSVAKNQRRGLLGMVRKRALKRFAKRKNQYSCSICKERFFGASSYYGHRSAHSKSSH